MLVLMTWAKRAGIDKAHLGSGMIIMCGLMGTLIAFLGKERISYLGSSIPLTLFGISVAVWPSPGAVIINGCMTLFVAGPATAFIMIYQLKHSGTDK